MARVLIAESDPMLLALLEDRLHVVGHEVSHLADPVQLPAEALDQGADLLIVNLGLLGESGLELVRTLRRTKGLRTLPILALAGEGGVDRVAALRAGVDELLSHPFDPEELTIRAERLLGSSSAAPAVMQGNLANHPTWELMQYVQQAGKSGELSVRGTRGGSGQLRAIDGRVSAARFRDLRGRDALLAILDLKSGSFRLVTEEGTDASLLGSDAFPIPEVLMQAAWLEDELAKRSSHLPATGARLEARLPKGLEIPEDLDTVPIAEIAEQIVESPGTRLYDLLKRSGFAPQRVRLALAWLVEQGVVGPEASGDDSLMTTTEISSTMVLDLAVRGLVTAAREAGFDTTNLPYLVLVEADVQPRLEAVLTSTPGLQHLGPVRSLIENLRLRQGGSATFETPEGQLSLHAQVLTPQVQGQIGAILSGCAGVLLWLGDGADREQVSAIVERLAATRGSAAGVLVGENPGSRPLIAELATTPRWHTTAHPPQSLVGVLRLLRPQTH